MLALQSGDVGVAQWRRSLVMLALLSVAATSVPAAAAGPTPLCPLRNRSACARAQAASLFDWREPYANGEPSCLGWATHVVERGGPLGPHLHLEAPAGDSMAYVYDANGGGMCAATAGHREPMALSPNISNDVYRLVVEVATLPAHEKFVFDLISGTGHGSAGWRDQILISGQSATFISGSFKHEIGESSAR